MFIAKNKKALSFSLNYTPAKSFRPLKTMLYFIIFVTFGKKTFEAQLRFSLSHNISTFPQAKSH